MDREKIFDEVRKIISEITGDFGSVEPESHIFDDLFCDTLDSVEIVMAVENEFDIRIGDDEFDDWETVNDIINSVERLTPQ